MINLLDFSPVRTPQEREELQYKLQQLRAVPPLSITGDIANHISIIFNKSKKNVDVNIFLLIDKIQVFSEYWAGLINEFQEKNAKSEEPPKNVPVTDLIDLTTGASDWKDHDEIELSKAIERIHFLESQLSASSDLLVKTQVKSAEYDLLMERYQSLQQENDELLKKMSGLLNGNYNKEEAVTPKPRTIQNKLQGKVEELKNTLNTFTKSASTKMQNISAVASPSQLLGNNNNNNNNQLAPSADDSTNDSDDAYNQDDNSSLPQEDDFYQKDQQLLIEIESFQRQISALMHEKNELARTNMHLEEELMDFQGKMFAAEKSIELLKGEKKELRDQLTTLQKQKQELEEIKLKIETDYKNQMKINKVLISTVNKLEIAMKDLNTKNEDYQREMNVLHTELITHKNHILENNEKFNSLYKKLNTYEKQIIQFENDKIILENEQKENLMKIENWQKDLILAKEKNALLKSDYEIIMNEKERVQHVLDLTQKKLIQREEQLEELITINSMLGAPPPASMAGGNLNGNNNNNNNNGGGLSPFARYKAAIGGGSTSPVPGEDGSENKFLKFARSAKQLSMVGTQKFKDAISSALTNEGKNDSNVAYSTGYNDGNAQSNQDDFHDYLLRTSNQQTAPPPAQSPVPPASQQILAPQAAKLDVPVHDQDEVIEVYHDLEDGDDGSSDDGNSNRNRNFSPIGR